MRRIEDYRHVIWDWNGTACLATLRLPPSTVLLIGDTLHDHEVARELGIDCALVAHGHHSGTRLRAASPHVFENLAALTQALGLA